ncbi:MAG: phytoene desaturase family protein [Bacillota bacterium]
MATSILIIGAGIAGLSTGCYAQMNGFSTQIFEMHDKPGGLCTAWRRKGYTFDYCIHNLAGTAPNSPYYRMWRELGALRSQTQTKARAHTEPNPQLHPHLHPQLEPRPQSQSQSQSQPRVQAQTAIPEAEQAAPHASPTGAPPSGPDVSAGCPIYHYREMVRVEEPSGKSLTIGPDIARLEQELKDLAPADAVLVDEYIQGVRAFHRFDLLSLPGAGFGGVLRMLPYAGTVAKWMKPTLETFAKRFSDPFLRRALPYIQYDMPGIPVGVHLNMLAGMGRQDYGWPIGGSLAFARAIEQRYRALGGQVHYKSKVAKILIENGRAVGVRLADGSEHRGDVVVSAADGHSTVFDMLEGRYTTQALRSYYTQAPESQEMALHVYFGVDGDLSREPHALALLLDKPVEIAGHTRDRLGVEILGSDPSTAPPGKTVLKVPLEADYAFWQSVQSRGEEAYRSAKEEVAAQVLHLLEARFPGLGRQVEAIDVSTPLTIERYTGNWRGLQAWLPPGNSMGIMLKGAFTTSLPGLADFFMVGQWACAMIGLNTVASAGRRLVRSLCRRYGRPFVTLEPEPEPEQEAG